MLLRQPGELDRMPLTTIMTRFKPTRRQFAAITAASALGLPAQTPASAVNVSVFPEVAIGEIRPELHSHFAEHLGNCTYNGLWVVGPNSPIPNLSGYRKDAVVYLKALGISSAALAGGMLCR